MAHLSASSSASFRGHENPGLDSIRELVISINDYVLDLLANAETWISLKQKCTSKLNIQKQKNFEFSEHFVLSNLYWGIDSIEAAILSEWPEEKKSQLRNSERMLQMPALLDEHGNTAGIPNKILISFSYFYLSILSYLQADARQTALHFLQSLLVSPGLVRTEIAPKLCGSLFPSHNIQEPGEDKINEHIREMAMRCKYQLTYFRVMLYGETPLQHSGCKDVSFLAYQSRKNEHGTSGAAEALVEDALHPSQLSEHQKVHPVDFLEDDLISIIDKSKTTGEIQDCFEASTYSVQIPKIRHDSKHGVNAMVRCLQNMLKEPQSDARTRVYDSESTNRLPEIEQETKGLAEAASMSAVGLEPETVDKILLARCPKSSQEGNKQVLGQVPHHKRQKESTEAYTTFPSRSLSSLGYLNLPITELRTKELNASWNPHTEDASSPKKLDLEELIFRRRTFTTLKSNSFGYGDSKASFAGNRKNLLSQKRGNGLHLHYERAYRRDLWEKLENKISKVLGNIDEHYAAEVATIYEMLSRKQGGEYTLLKDVILDQLLVAISSSREEKVIRASVSILTTIISANKAALEDVKKRGLQLRDLASALKQNVQEAAILIYLIKPSPMEIKSLELLPALVEVACTSLRYKGRPSSAPLTPPAASLIMIEVLVTAFDCATNGMHLAAINSPKVLSGLLTVAQNRNRGEFISLANILVKCMQFDGQSRKYISQLIQVAPFIRLLHSNDKRTRSITLVFFYEILRMPRSSAIQMLEQIRKEGSFDIMETLGQCIQQFRSDHQLLAANLLLQLNALGYTWRNTAFRQNAMEALLEAVTCCEGSTMQLLSACILSNLGGTYSWTGKPYTVAWLAKRAGLTSLCHRNMIKNIDWLDQSLQDTEIDGWCSKMTRSIMDISKPIFDALQKGLKSKVERISRECLTAIAWLSFDISKSPESIKPTCDVLLGEIQQLLHPGLELEERLLACLCIYNYASRKGMQKLNHFSEAVRESLRRFSHVTWMADELHKVTDYLANKSRISCVHTQILEMHQSGSGAVTALIYYKGFLFSGYSDGSVKVWDVKGQTATLLWDIREHKNAVTCFAPFEPGDSLLSGSLDKTIKVWQIIERKPECVEVITTKEAIRKVDAYGKMIFVVTKGHKIKLLGSSKILKGICKSKSVKCMAVIRGKIYVGCTDSSIQELTITTNREKEIKAPTRSWRIQNKPITAIVVYKDWLYSSSSHVEGSNLKDLKRHYQPQMSITAEKGANIIAMGVVEDFIYLNRSSAASNLQIWLRRTQQKVGRLPAGSKITSLLTANDIVYCGTEAGAIKGWIPL